MHYASHIAEEGEAFLEAARDRGLEGIVAKHRRSLYEPGKRSKSWLKLKIRREQELVVCGYIPGQGSHTDLGSLIVGVYEDGELRHAGQVGSGIDTRTRARLKAQLDDLQRADAPFPKPPRIKGARWAEPRLVIRAEFAEWTTDSLLRQAAFKGLEIDRDPTTVEREHPSDTDAARRSAARAARAAAAAPPELKSPKQRTGSRRSPDPGPVASAPPTPLAAAPPLDPSEPPQAATPDEMAALEAMRKDGVWEIGGHEIKVSNLDKVLFPDAGFTKRDLIRYYVTVAPVLLPYLRGRCLNLWRWPDGITGNHFWQKEIPAYAPKWMDRWAYPDASSTEAHTYIVPDRVATLAWLANHATIDMHPWTSRTEAYRSPTYALIDIDPGEKTTWEEVLLFARLYRAALQHLGVTGFPKVTGKRGIQVWVPIRPIYSFDDTRGWVESVSRAVGASVPELVSWEWEKRSRRGLARLDFTQNAVNKTLVAPYAVRPAPGAPVPAPIRWEELEDPDLRPNRWNIRTILERLQQEGDLFRGALELEQELPPL